MALILPAHQLLRVPFASDVNCSLERYSHRTTLNQKSLVSKKARQGTTRFSGCNGYVQLDLYSNA